jgi:hypothetical protein
MKKNVSKREKGKIGAFHSERRVETEGVSKSEDIETNPKADSHPGTNRA